LTDEYRLYRLDGMGQIANAVLLDARDDDDAIRQARELGRSSLKCEVWQSARLVTILDRQDLGSSLEGMTGLNWPAGPNLETRELRRLVDDSAVELEPLFLTAHDFEGNRLRPPEALLCLLDLPDRIHDPPTLA
jgi:hypothetical protein